MASVAMYCRVLIHGTLTAGPGRPAGFFTTRIISGSPSGLTKGPTVPDPVRQALERDLRALFGHPDGADVLATCALDTVTPVTIGPGGLSALIDKKQGFTFYRSDGQEASDLPG
jgi:hypothetical protein